MASRCCKLLLIGCKRERFSNRRCEIRSSLYYGMGYTSILCNFPINVKTRKSLEGRRTCFLLADFFFRKKKILGPDFCEKNFWPAPWLKEILLQFWHLKKKFAKSFSCIVCIWRNILTRKKRAKITSGLEVISQTPLPIPDQNKIQSPSFSCRKLNGPYLQSTDKFSLNLGGKHFRHQDLKSNSTICTSW